MSDLASIDFLQKIIDSNKVVDVTMFSNADKEYSIVMYLRDGSSIFIRQASLQEAIFDACSALENNLNKDRN